MQSGHDLRRRQKGRSRPLPRGAGFHQPEQGRITALETNDAAHQTGPDPGRRGECQGIRNPELDLSCTEPRRAGLAELIYRHEFEIDPVIGNQPQAAVARIFDGHGAFRPQVHLQAQHPWIADLRLDVPAIWIVYAARIKNRRQLRPYLRDPRAAGGALDLREESCQPVGAAGQAGHGHFYAALGQFHEQALVAELPQTTIQGRRGKSIRLQSRRQPTQRNGFQALGRSGAIGREKSRLTAQQT